MEIAVKVALTLVLRLLVGLQRELSASQGFADQGVCRGWPASGRHDRSGALPWIRFVADACMSESKSTVEVRPPPKWDSEVFTMVGIPKHAGLFPTQAEVLTLL
jgi:hypothetical protein